MPAIEIDQFLAPIAPDDACGPNLEYDPAFAELDRLAEGKAEQQIGSTVVPAEDPDWKAVQKAAQALLARSKDLRVATHLCKALLRTSGWPGLAAGLATLRALVEQSWEGVHPRLDPEDDNDPTIRANVLAGLADAAVLTAIRNTPLVSSRTLGRFSLRDVEVAAGDAPPPAEGTAATAASLEGALMDCDIAVLEDTTAAARTCVEALAGLEAALADKVTASATPDLGRLSAQLRKATAFLGAGLARRNPAAGIDSGGEFSSGGGGAGPAGISSSGGISSRDDVLRALDRICEYYARHEPSSPVPMFMERSKRLVTMNFVDIIRELVPEMLAQVELLRGRDQQ
jgi:type VI secretion system protein ImpA